MKHNRSWPTTLARWLAVGLLFVFVMGSIALFLLTLRPGERVLKRIAESQLRNLLRQEVQIGQVETNLLSRLQVSEVRIQKTDHGTSIPLLRLGHARLDYRLLDLLLRRRSVKALDVDSLYVHIQRDRLGNLNLPPSEPSTGKPTTETQKRPLSFQVGYVSIQHSSFLYQDQSIPLDVSIHNLNVRSTHQREDTYGVHLQADAVRVTYQDIPVTAKAMELNGHWNPKRGQLESFSMILPGLELTGNAEVVQAPSGSSVTAAVQLQGNPAALAHIVRTRIPGPFYPIEGDMRLALHITGSLNQPKVAARFEVPNMQIADLSVTDGFIQASWQAETIRLEKLRMQLFGGDITGQGEISTDTLLTHRLHLNVEDMDLAQIWQAVGPQAPPVPGRIALHVSSTGQAKALEKVEMTADLILSQMYYNARVVPDIVTRLHLKRGQAVFHLKQADSEVSADAQLDGTALKGAFSVNIAQLAPLSELLNVPELNGQLKGKGTLAGTQDAPEIRAEFTGRKIQYQNFPVDTLVGQVEYQNKQPYLSNLYVAGQLDSINPLWPPFHLADLRGGIHYRASARGSLENPQAELTVNLFNPGYGGYRLDRGQLHINVRDQQVRLSSLEWMKDSLWVHATGEYTIPSSAGSVQINLYALPSGTALSKPDQVDTTLIERSGIGTISAAFDLRDTDHVSIKVRGEQLDIAKISTLVPDALDIEGRLGFDLNVRGHLSTPEAGLRFHAAHLRYEHAQMDSINGEVQLADDQVELKHLGLYVGGQYSWANGAVALKRRTEGGYEVSPQSALRAQVYGRELDLRVLTPFLPPGMEMAGHISYDVSAYGTVGVPRMTGTVVLREGKVQPGPEAPPIQDLQVDLSVQDSTLVIEKVSGVLQDIPWRLQGSVTATHRPWKTLDLNLNLGLAELGTMIGSGTIFQDSLRVNVRMDQMDLSALQPFVPDLKGLSGTCHTALVIHGPLNNPELDGNLEVRGLALQLPMLNEKLDSGIVKIAFTEKEAEIDSVFLSMNGGTLWMSGSVVHDRGKLSDMDLRAQMDNIRIVRPREAIVYLKSGRFTYAKRNNYYVLDGDMVLGESRVTYSFRPQALLSLIQAVERPKPEVPALLQQTRIHIRLRESEKIWIDNNVARLRLHTELGITGSPVQPNLTGRIAVEEGYVLYLDRKFKITQGVVDFIDPNRLNPIVDLKMETTVKAYQAMEGTPYTITLAISGALDQKVVEITSEPPLETSDIVALLTLGATREQLTGKDAEGSGTSVGGVLLDRAAALSGQRISGYATRRLGNLLGLEQMSIEGNLFQRGKSSGPQLLASRKLSDRMEVTYTTTVGYFNDYSIRLDYRLSKHVSLQGQTDQRGRQAIDLKYGVRFR